MRARRQWLSDNRTSSTIVKGGPEVTEFVNAVLYIIDVDAYSHILRIQSCLERENIRVTEYD